VRRRAAIRVIGTALHLSFVYRSDEAVARTLQSGSRYTKLRTPSDESWGCQSMSEPTDVAWQIAAPTTGTFNADLTLTAAPVPTVSTV
jgi:hypothetical protein